ncbi:MAG: energy-coupling factor ABC transporter permease [Acidobacteriia bacterium]|nr:energy-coupling factor ABC transporter permease [Terriglobia bacterium]
MHVPDGFLTNRIALSLDALSGASILYAARRLKLESSARVIPIMGVLSAFIFAGQMLNFPVFGGTSGHLVGGALLGILLGPAAGLLTMATVITAQALFLQDGGLVALGANIFNIGAVTVFSGYAVFRLFGAPEGAGKRLFLAGFVAAWFSLVLSSAACALELGLSGAVPLRIGLPTMAGYHAVIGVVEAALTAGVLSFLARVRPDLLQRDFRPRFGFTDWLGGLVLVAIPLAMLVLAGSSSLPDPLQALLSGSSKLAEQQESLLSSNRYNVFGVLLYLALLAVCGAVYLVARRIRLRRGQS